MKNNTFRRPPCKSKTKTTSFADNLVKPTYKQHCSRKTLCKINILGGFSRITFFPSSPNLAAHKMQQLKRIPMVYSMLLPLVAKKSYLQKTILNTILFMNIQEYSEKIGLCLELLRCSILWTKCKNDISMISRPRKILGIQPTYFYAYVP